MIDTNLFTGRCLLIATKHEKEKVIAPILEKELGVTCIVAKNFNTDTFGTFSGDIERKDEPVETARNKCLQAMELYNYDLAIASEGSFGPHPTIHFVPADDEILIFIDKKNNIEIIARELNTKTNFNRKEIKSENELNEFANKANFPSHGLILKKTKGNFTEISKGITDWNLLHKTFHRLLQEKGIIYVETDMRAMFNPTRMSVIEKTAIKLANKIKSCCPNCNMPGFSITEAKKGLPCALCNFPTSSTLIHIYTCKKCNFTQEQKYPYGKHKEDPMYCDICNP